MKSLNQVKLMTGITQDKHAVFANQWTKDVKLLDWGPRSLFPEYLEMGIELN